MTELQKDEKKQVWVSVKLLDEADRICKIADIKTRTRIIDRALELGLPLAEKEARALIKGQR